MTVWTTNSSDDGFAKNYNFTGGATGKNFSNIDSYEWWNNATNVAITYDPNAQFWYIMYPNIGNNGYPWRQYLKTDSSGTISSDNDAVIFSQGANKIGAFYHPVEKTHVFIGTEWGQGHKIGYDVTNLTSTNYIGISNAAYADGETATVQIIGGVDDAQSSLTAGSPAYVQRAGTITTSADTPSVIAGTAISATKIIVKG